MISTATRLPHSLKNHLLDYAYPVNVIVILPMVAASDDHGTLAVLSVKHCNIPQSNDVCGVVASVGHLLAVASIQIKLLTSVMYFNRFFK